jgi:S1-C subfamily serine protease
MKTSLYRLFAAILVTAILAPARPVHADDSQPAANSNPEQPPEQAHVERLQFVSPANDGHFVSVRLSTLLTRTDSLIGVESAQVDDVLRSHLGLTEGKGVLITNVTADGPAAKAGVQKNDVLVAVADQEIGGPETLDKLLEAVAEKPTPIILIRGGHKQTLTVTPNAPALRIAWTQALNAPQPRFWLGVGLAAADDTLRSHLAVPAGEGLVVTSVEAESPAAKSGVMANDLLLKLDGKALTTVEALSSQLQEIGEKSVALEFLRNGKPAMLTVTPVKKAAEQWVTSVIDSGATIWAADSLATTLVPTQTGLSNVITFDVVGLDTGIQTNAASPQTPDLAAQVSELLEQVGKLQKALEALDAAVKAQTLAPPAGTEKKK